MNDDKVLEALQVIKKYCEEQNVNCEGCKLYVETDKSCTLDITSPADWEINVDKKYKFIL
jgi:hypothetical protein